MITLTRKFSALAIAGLLGASVLAVTGCKSARLGGSTEPDKVIDELRQSNMELQAQVAQLQQNIYQRLAEINTLQQQVNGAKPIPGVELPQAASIQLDRYSGPVDTNHDKHDDLIRLYVKPKDQQGRQMLVAGQAALQAVVIRPNAEPVRVGQRDYSPQAWSEAYRSGITGTHYTLELPLTLPLPKGAKQVTVQITLTDASTGATLTQQAVMDVR